MGRSDEVDPRRIHTHSSGSVARARRARAATASTIPPVSPTSPRRPGTTLLRGRGTRRHHGADHVVDVSATGGEELVHELLGGVFAELLTQAGEDLF